VRDVLTNEQVNEIADAPAGVVMESARYGIPATASNAAGASLSTKSDAERMGVEGALPSASPVPQPTGQAGGQPKIQVASVSDDGKVTFQARKE
jgi:hypothetical protein